MAEMNHSWLIRRPAVYRAALAIAGEGRVSVAPVLRRAVHKTTPLRRINFAAGVSAAAATRRFSPGSAAAAIARQSRGAAVWLTARSVYAGSGVNPQGTARLLAFAAPAGRSRMFIWPREAPESLFYRFVAIGMNVARGLRGFQTRGERVRRGAGALSLQTRRGPDLAANGGESFRRARLGTPPRLAPVRRPRESQASVSALTPALSAPSNFAVTRPLRPVAQGAAPAPANRENTNSAATVLPEAGNGVADGQLSAMRLDRAIDDYLARQSRLPPSGMTGFDPRLSPAWAGLQIPG